MFCHCHILVVIFHDIKIGKSPKPISMLTFANYPYFVFLKRATCDGPLQVHVTDRLHLATFWQP